jgi:hypothetical protein
MQYENFCNNSLFRCRSLSSNAITSTIPTEIAGLSSLTFLDLSYNRLTGTIPQEFSHLNAKIVYLQGNQLSGSVPLLTNAAVCALQTANDTSSLCCPIGPAQLCCAQDVCHCTSSLPCSGYTALAVGAAPPTCGVNNNAAFVDGDKAGCLCEMQDGSRECIVGSWAESGVTATPVAQWNLGDNNTSIPDDSGNGFDGVLVGSLGPQYTFAPYNKSVYLSLSGGFVVIPSMTNFVFGVRDFSIQATIRSSAPPDVEFMNIFSKRSPCFCLPFVVVYLHRGKLTLEMGDEMNDYTHIAASDSLETLTDGTWHRFEVTRQGNNISLIVDGSVRTSQTTAFVFDIRDNLTPALIGAQYNMDAPAAFELSSGGASFIGDIANVSVYVGTIPQTMCSASGGALSANALVCPIIRGFCSPTKDAWNACCGVDDCALCVDYSNCIQNIATTLQPTTAANTDDTAVVIAETTVSTDASTHVISTLVTPTTLSPRPTALSSVPMVNNSFVVAVTSASKSASLIGRVVGGIVGGLVTLCVVIVIIILVKRRQQHTERPVIVVNDVASATVEPIYGGVTLHSPGTGEKFVCICMLFGGRGVC